MELLLKFVPLPLTSTTSNERKGDNYREGSPSVQNPSELDLRRFSGMVNSTSRTRGLQGLVDILECAESEVCSILLFR